MMPVGIQMFATITSKDHAKNIQQDLQNIYFTDSYRDTIIQCADGHMIISRLLTGLLFPFLKDNLSFQILEEATLLLPQYNKLEIEKSIYNLLGIKYSDQSQEPQDESLMSEWTEAIDTIIDTLEPEKEAGVGRVGKMKTRFATLHSAFTKETAVIHASNEDDKDYSDSVLVVNEVDTDDGGSDSGKLGRQRKRRQFQVGQQHKPAPVEHDPVEQTHQVPQHQAPRHIPQHQVEQPQSVSQDQVQQPQELEEKHVELNEGGLIIPRGYLCSICNTLFAAQDLLETHFKIHSQKYKCQICKAAFSKMRDLTDHTRTHSGQKLVECKICDKDFTEKGLRLHIERFHKVELEACKPVKKRELKLESGSQQPLPTDPLQPNQQPAESEQETQDDVMETESSYPQNNVYFSSSDSNPDEPDWDESEKAPVKVRKTELCGECDKYFTKKGIKIHNQKHHSENLQHRRKSSKVKAGKKPALKKMFSCMYCHKKFSHNASMKVHEKVHLGGKPHHCDMCEAKFSNKFDLYAHEKEHSALMPHKCDQCSQTFKTPESLRFHKLIHEESVTLSCRYCTKKYKNRNQLETHERVHVGEKPFQCPNCTHSFETATKLTRHITANHLKE